jgi:predicted hydrocarbon binding protein
MDYLSARDMCALAQGFVEGVAAWYMHPVEFRHLQCKQHGHDHCTFAMTWAGEAQRSVAA